MPAISKREQIISAALKLFYHDGFNATGIDRIITEAGVSKKTLYNHFKSKDELILVVLRKRDETFRNKIMRETERLASTAAERLLSIFDAHHNWFNEKDFSGCMFINASAEFSSQQDPKHILCAEHKTLIKNYICSIAKEANIIEPEILTEKINLLLEGAIVEAHVSGNKDSVLLAKDIARELVEKSS